MWIRDTAHRRPAENLVPMINVVFLLLIFFLMTAQIAPPEPFDVAPPTARSAEDPGGDLTLYLDAEGTLGFRDATGDQALAALVRARDEACGGPCDEDTPALMLRADQAVDAGALAALMPRLGRAGFSAVALITVQP